MYKPIKIKKGKKRKASSPCAPNHFWQLLRPLCRTLGSIEQDLQITMWFEITLGVISKTPLSPECYDSSLFVVLPTWRTIRNGKEKELQFPTCHVSWSQMAGRKIIRKMVYSQAPKKQIGGWDCFQKPEAQTLESELCKFQTDERRVQSTWS